METTETKMAKIEKDVEYMKTSLHEHARDQKDDLKEIKGMIKEQTASFGKFIDSNEKKHDEIYNRIKKETAPRWVAHVVAWLGVTLGGVIIYKLADFLVEAFKHIER